MAGRIERVKACLNGSRGRAEHPAVPITPAELAREAAGAVGLPTRIGLEDTTTGPAGQPVTGNAELTRLALAAWTAARC